MTTAHTRPDTLRTRSTTPAVLARGRRLLFQDVPESKSVKNRLHIDVHGEPGWTAELLSRLKALGATELREVDKGPAGAGVIPQTDHNRCRIAVTR